LKADPLDEEALGAYLRVLFSAGKRKQALDAYEAFRRLLKRELDVEPLETTRVLFESLSSSDLEVVSVAVPRARHNLPAQTTRFVGRQRELAKLAALLEQPDCRLLTLVGLGGVGKTRLGLELVAKQLESYRDGVWFVPLAGVGSPDLLISSIAGALQLSFSGSGDPKEQLGDFLREKELLLLLDNFEHLVEGAVLLEELLEVAPAVRMLVTSRIALELSAEWLFDLEGLSYPPVDTEEPLTSFDAVKLFINRAERLSSTFVPQGDTLQAVAELTRKVEGLPLALELAASWTRSLSVPQLLTELAKSFDVLSGQLRDLPERHRSLRTVFDYSWERLGEGERQALAKLSIFPGGFTLEAAERVADVHLALLLNLINHSLLRRSLDERYTIHELVRQYAANLGAGSEPHLENKFSSYYLELIVHHEDELRGPAPKRVLREIALEIDNLRLACRLALEHDDWTLLGTALTGVRTFFHRAELFQEGEYFFEYIVARLEAYPQASRSSEAQILYARALLSLASFERLTGSHEKTRVLLERAATLLRASNRTDELAYSLCLLADVTYRLGDHATTDTLFAESASLSQAIGARHLHATVLREWAWLKRAQGAFREAIDLVKQCLALREELHDAYGVAEALESLTGLLRETEGLAPEHFDMLERALSLYQQAGSRQGEADINNMLALHARDTGDYQRGEQLFQACLEVARHTGNRLDQATLLFNLGESLLRRGQPASALAYLQQALDVSEPLHSLGHQMLVLVSMAEGARQQGRLEDAKAHLYRSLKLASDNAVGMGLTLRALYYLATLYAQDDCEQAGLLATFVFQSKGGFLYTRNQAKQLLQELGSKLFPEAMSRLEQEAASLSLETLLARQLTLLENAPSTP
jgi:tetratricopeptide (TPR) repeat protein